MLFKKDHVDMILSGRKTQTRRTGNKRWTVGKIYKACRSYTQCFAHIKVTAIRKETLGTITAEDAYKEGYDSIPEYIDVFKRIYGWFQPYIEVWVVDFELSDEEAYYEQYGGKTGNTNTVRHK